MYLVVGLGNPGEKYARNRHNIGFMAADEIVRRHSFSPYRAKFQGEIAEGKIGTHRVLVLKPQTFMNESGRSVKEVVTFYKIAPEDILVLHDELDLAPGKLRVKRGGGHAGHNGLRSLHAHVGDVYTRVRLGIGHPGSKEQVTGHVLNDFAKADQDWMTPQLDAVADNIELIFAEQDSEFMSRVAQAVKPPRSSNTTAKTEKGES
ncbi:aminoacyl-tRNA hydrolase [Magnetovibrio blakemorei]|uniref:Peptidyl-tRNA hydrolase n=1 Tax=Magnetovibrio blakemorei TaxID=28181 RepID=A0A1E5Q7R0_9PROT|nr:aminoacyl-tRNA hydrolase [Magnetovibrio blakemorei]